MTRLALTGARIFDGERLREGDAVVIDGARIEAVMPQESLERGIKRHDLDCGLIAPGFIDAQVNGGGGALFNDDPSLGTIARIATAHRRFGTTGLLPTVITDVPEIMRAAMRAVADARLARMPGILGIHIEGPFIDQRRRGAHAERFIRAITPGDVDELLGLDCGTVLVTLAPSKVGPEIIAELAAAGIIVSLGHAEASAAEALAALATGARGFTHLYNAMSGLGGRVPGMVGAALTDRESWCGLIADGHHVDPVALKLALAAKPKGKLFLVTDAMPPAAGGPARFSLQGREITAKGGRLELADDTLAGSNLTMDRAVRYCCAELGVEREEALRMASLYAAAFLRLDNRRGRIAPGYMADLVHLDDELNVLGTWVDGESSEHISLPPRGRGT